MKLSRLRNDSRWQRRIVLSFYGILIMVVAATSALLAWASWQHPASRSDRFAETGDIFAGGTLLLALLAALVALQAYGAATGLPDIQFQICFPFSYSNRPEFITEVDEYGNVRVKSFKQTWGSVSVRNTSGYSARNPAVIIRLQGMAFTLDDLAQGWADIDFAQTQGVTGVQWDGGMYSIHGRSARRLPSLDFRGLHPIPAWGESKLVVELLAEGGYRRELEIPVRFLPDGSKLGQELPISEQPPGWL